jgi:hypothetical protein
MISCTRTRWSPPHEPADRTRAGATGTASTFDAAIVLSQLLTEPHEAIAVACGVPIVNEMNTPFAWLQYMQLIFSIEFKYAR